MQASRSLKQVIASLHDTFTSIDIRAVGAKKKVATQWECIFLKVRLTSDNRKLLEVYEKKKKDLDAKINVRFRLFAECRDIHELDSTINEIQNGLITLEEFPLKLLQSIADAKISNDKYYINIPKAMWPDVELYHQIKQLKITI